MRRGKNSPPTRRKSPLVTLTVTEEIRRRMDDYPDINWSEVARKAFVQAMHESDLKKLETQKGPVVIQVGGYQ